MDLFSDKKEDVKLLGEWTNYFSSKQLEDLNKNLDDLYYSSNNIIYPDYNDIFNALKYTNISNTNVVCLGQDPYYNGNANGFAFACKNEASSSLKLIIKAIENNFKYKSDNFDISLKHWVRDGVLLLNTAFTVEKDKPNSHKNKYNFIIDRLIEILNSKTYLVWLLWGKESQSFEKLINKSHLILKCEHPAKAAREGRNWDCNHFTITNQYLYKHNKKIINWYE